MCRKLYNLINRTPKIPYIPDELEAFLLSFGHLGFPCHEVIYAQSIFQEHTVEMITTAWSRGVPKDYLPFCYDNADYYCVSLTTGRVRFWSHGEEVFPDAVCARKDVGFVNRLIQIEFGID